MTIFQKMLFVPVLSLLLYCGFIIYSYSEHQHSSERIESIRDNYLPLLEIVHENTRLFEELTEKFKDAVLAGESNWIKNTLLIKQRVEGNLTKLEHYPEIVDIYQLEKTRENFIHYYTNASSLAKSILLDESALSHTGDLIANVERYHNDTISQIQSLRKSIDARFRQIIDETSYSLNKMIFWSVVISVVSMFVILAAMMLLALSTRRSLHQVVIRMKELALGGSDFSRRLERTSKDELGLLIYWFNKLSDKLEQDYVDLETISITDKLTQLNNRTRTDVFFPKAIQKAMKKNQPLCAVLLDIDFFKKINDTHGHLTGDKILQSMAGLLKENAGQRDFIGRWGGEEFIIILPDCDGNNAYKKMEALRKEIEQFDFPDVSQVTVSFGVAMAIAGDTSESIMARADKCLYAAKDRGRNCVVLDETN
ncbi:MAG: diguanylate cyclase [Bermanella sp.]